MTRNFKELQSKMSPRGALVWNSVYKRLSRKLRQKSRPGCRCYSNRSVMLRSVARTGPR